jgi:flagellar basal body rod protein FlgC
MISGVSAALRGLSVSSARAEQATMRVAASTSPDAAALAAGGVATSDAMVHMAVAQFAFMASVRAAQQSTEMVAQTLGMATTK